MSRGRNSHAQNRGQKLRMSPAALDNYARDMERLAADMGVNTTPTDPGNTKEADDIGFGLPEVLAVASLWALSGIINMMAF